MSKPPTPREAKKLRKHYLHLRKIPEFKRCESWRYVRVKPNWRRPRGIDNKMRLQKKGWPPLVKIGYRKPKIIRGLHPSGYREVLIRNLKDLEKVNPDTDAVRIAGSVGLRLRLQIYERCKELNIKVLNPPTTRS